jgi:import inner membrane translocase subunit TIM22
MLYIVSGYGLGAAIGLFSASVNPTITGAEAQQQTAREVLRDLKTSMLTHAKNFAIVGAIFVTVECSIESVSVFEAF